MSDPPPPSPRSRAPAAVACLVAVAGLVLLLAVCAGSSVLWFVGRSAPDIEAVRMRRAAAAAEVRREEAARGLLESLAARIEARAREWGELPEALPEPPPADPWGTSVVYERASPERGALRSAGPDRRHGTRDDVVRALALR